MDRIWRGCFYSADFSCPSSVPIPCSIRVTSNETASTARLTLFGIVLLLAGHRCSSDALRFSGKWCDGRDAVYLFAKKERVRSVLICTADFSKTIGEILLQENVPSFS